MNSMVVNQDALHLEISLLTVLLVLEFNKGILQTISCSFVANHFTRQDLSKATEDQL